MACRHWVAVEELGETMLSFFAGPVGGHLAASAGWIGGGSDGLEHLVGDGVAEGEAEGAIAIVGEEPVVTGAHGHGGGDEESLMAGAGDLEEDFLLAFEDDFAVVTAAGEVHEPVKLDHLLGRQEVGFDLPTAHCALCCLLRHAETSLPDCNGSAGLGRFCLLSQRETGVSRGVVGPMEGL